MNPSRKKILGAFLVGTLLVGVAFIVKVITPQPETKDSDRGSLAVVNKSSGPRARIEVSDKDNDGIPDWQEALQRTEPVILTEVEENYEPETVTEEFSIDFFQDMMLSRNYGEFGATPEEIAERATKQMAAEAIDELYGANDITLSTNNTPVAVKAYGNKLAQIVLDNTRAADAPNEVEVLRQAYSTDNPEMLEELDTIIAMYKDMVNRTLATEVPSEYSKEHLDLVNVYNAVYNDIIAMKGAFTDPLQTVIRLKRYREDVSSLYVVLLNLQKKMILNGVTFSEEDPAYRFIIQ